MEAVDRQEADLKKRPREEGENVSADENPEKKFRPLEPEKETSFADAAAQEDKVVVAAVAEVEASEVAAELEAEVEIHDGEAEAKASVTAGAEVEAKASAAAGAEVEAEAHNGEAPVSFGEDKASAFPSEAKLGPKFFSSSMDMFNFFYELLHNWPLNLDLNKYEHLMLVGLINQGHPEPEKKIGTGIATFQVRVNPEFYSRCYYIVRTDGSVEDFSYRKCVDNILSLPKEFKSRSGDLRLGDKKKGGHQDNHGRGGGGHRGGGRRGGGGGWNGRGNRGRKGRF